MIAIIKYNAGNISSVKNALNRIGVESVVTDSHQEILAADKVIFPGVGEASSAMSYLKQNELDTLIQNCTKPFLGICLGLQLMCKTSEEGNVECLKIFNSKVKKFPENEKVPHMGWNNFKDVSGVLINYISEVDNMYYVHSYYAEVCQHTTAICDYILPFSAAMQKDNFYATQFHPEKSADLGEKLLKNFLEI